MEVKIKMKNECKKCKKGFELMVVVYLNTNTTEIYCYSCFSSLIFKNPLYINRIINIKYRKLDFYEID